MNLGAGVQAEDRPVEPSEQLRVGKNIVDTHYFSTLSIRIESGRSFTEADTHHAPRVAIVNRRLADLLWPGQDAIGRRLRKLAKAAPGWKWLA